MKGPWAFRKESERRVEHDAANRVMAIEMQMTNTKRDLAQLEALAEKYPDARLEYAVTKLRARTKIDAERLEDYRRRMIQVSNHITKRVKARWAKHYGTPWLGAGRHDELEYDDNA